MNLCGDCRACCLAPTLWKGGLLAKNNSAIPKEWVVIKLREAKRRNPHLVQFVKKNPGNKKVTFFKCRALTDHGCSIYADRLPICRGYPGYGVSLNSETMTLILNRYEDIGAEYTRKCTHLDIFLKQKGEPTSQEKFDIKCNST